MVRRKKITMIASLFFITVGVALAGYSVFQILQGNKEQTKSLAKAEKIIEQVKTQDEKKSEIIVPSFDFAKGEEVGILEVPKLNEKLPIIQGTDEEELRKGVGHYDGTAYPTQKDQIVLSGHRDTVFRRFDQLAIGDLFIVRMPYGNYIYEIVDTKIVDADDRTIIVPTSPKEVLTVTTCYPFTYVGNAPDRYIITAKPVDGTNKSKLSTL